MTATDHRALTTTGKRVVKVSRADVVAAQTRVQADRLLGRKTPEVIARVAAAAPSDRWTER
ncbi:hypothetical protein GCM10011594_35060 [Nakamurella endophytica]|uniref:Uncharacterized protein n=1 Tax=Nakamurella endophytica TaxID=1748367 RepID=A0A917T762_9ACTN|nr:hypothetical protein GCM10011594_35060 [Nakamurella endophytica]